MTSNVLEEYRRYRVPRAPGSTLVLPQTTELIGELQSPLTFPSPDDFDFCGNSLDDVRRQARREVVRLALDYTSQYAAPDQVERLAAHYVDQRPVVLSGHQPELFHAGVWFKNFLLGKLNNSADAITINFLVDNDLCRHTSIRVPALEKNGRLAARQVAFDEPRESTPWELRSIRSRATWESFPGRVVELLQSGQATGGFQQPLLSDLWPEATRALERTGQVGAALAQARHMFELQAGVSNLEVPLSRLVSTQAFARFSIGLLAGLPRFHEIYNRQRQRYRDAHRIRNNAHPVPPLEQEENWLEAPWWIYRSTAPQRQRLWVRMLDEQLILSDRAGWQESIDGRLDCDQAAGQWLEILNSGVCLRPRALLTTMYLRLFVADLFVHGIGGGKYDQLTNGILQEFVGIEPPPMAVATATLQLPNIPSNGVGGVADLEEEIHRLEHRQWQWKYHADKRDDELPENATALVAKKRQLLANIPPKGEKWEWHQAITRVNEELRDLASDQLAANKQRVDQLAVELRQAQLLESREYSFCLYPQQFIVPELKRLSGLAN